jgi:RNA polymerase sigma-B factor
MIATYPVHSTDDVVGMDAATNERLLRRYHRRGDLLARDEVIRRCIPLARRLASRYRAAAPIEDMRQVAAVGLIKAVDGFDPGRGIPFNGYAIPTIVGELKRHIRDQAWSVHVPRALKDRAVQIDRATRALSASLGRQPSIAELAEVADLHPDEVLDAIAARAALGSESLDAPRYGGADGGLSYADAIGAEDLALDFDHAPGLIRSIRSLPQREQTILHLRFEQELSQAEIAEKLGISQMHVSRLMRRTLDRLRPVVERQAA